MPNRLIVGANKLPILDGLPDRYLFIDDGDLIDRLKIPVRRAVTFFDPAKHSINPLKDMTYARARSFLDMLNAVFPEGENTLTKRYSNFVLLVGSSRVDLQACKLEYSIVSPK